MKMLQPLISFNEGYQNNKQISDLERNCGAASLGD